MDEINQIIKEFVVVRLTEAEWKKIISPEYFVEIRSIQGGPNPTEVQRMIDERKHSLANKIKDYEQTVMTLNQKHKMLIEFSF